ncbi:MAG: hypothetical protein WB996_09995 [Ignavibacteriaceae bacterium]
MDEFKDIKRLWNSKNTLGIPNLEQIRIVINNYQRKKKRNAFLLTALFILCGIAFILILLLHKPLLWTTTFGEILISMGFILGMILKLNTLKRIKNIELKPNIDFLEDLIKDSVRNKSKINWHLIITVLLLAIGYGFFIYEEIKDNKFELTLSYLGIAIFTFAMYFVFRPFIKRSSKKKIQKMIDEIIRLK